MQISLNHSKSLFKPPFSPPEPNSSFSTSTHSSNFLVLLESQLPDPRVDPTVYKILLHLAQSTEQCQDVQFSPFSSSFILFLNTIIVDVSSKPTTPDWPAWAKPIFQNPIPPSFLFFFNASIVVVSPKPDWTKPGTQDPPSFFKINIIGVSRKPRSPVTWI